MAQVAQLGKLPRQVFLAFRVLPSNRKIFSRQLEKFFLPTGKNFPSDKKKFSSCPSVNHSNFRKLRTFWSNFRKNFSFRQEKFFLPTGHKRMTDVPLPECLPKPEEPTAPAPQQTY
ncbi:hypothetical protein TVAG_411600 [Trichomonas vaginalis G3]|uniref:Uncharacterized protein n=1 Tax=Trichomonas vaginalis (strain ATCC PRA-98 / G3) TaxID=412133 RepID=A2GVG6_TRIV3|nr:hypothetical protein TVAGG3_0051200 [Trichomonas vaginalis G3]EAX78851.1 hypothetical protein TVAG_411600 [Trichomonas vaginalis G3]KAI5541410.1 hypothetical protein TVAGG3_0051200 [Trichomonas vaginalis G3]|eukprot:XP_001291781.1 hypothetical protein [Trichomonas vaginalis G3]